MPLTSLITEVFSFDPEEYPFHDVIADFLGVDDLSNLTMDESKMRHDWSLYKNMEQSACFHLLYEKLTGPEGEPFYELYQRFIQDEIRPKFSEAILYQATPSHRLFFKNLKGQARFHKDRDYGHLPAEINFLVPQTSAFENNTLWLESETGRADYKPVNLQLGEYVKFKGSVLKHGGKQNTTDRSRISFDFRVLPWSEAPRDFLQQQEKLSKSTGNPIMDNAQKFLLCE